MKYIIINIIEWLSIKIITSKIQIFRKQTITWIDYILKPKLYYVGITESRNIIKIYNLNFIKNIHTVSKYKIMGTKGKKIVSLKEKYWFWKIGQTKMIKKLRWILKQTFASLKFILVGQN